MDLQLLIALMLGAAAVCSLLRRFCGRRSGRKPAGSCPLCQSCDAHDPPQARSLETLMEAPRRSRR